MATAAEAFAHRASKTYLSDEIVYRIFLFPLHFAQQNIFFPEKLYFHSEASEEGEGAEDGRKVL